MGVIFDTSVLVYLERNLNQIEKIIAGRENEPFGISVITVCEHPNFSTATLHICF